MSHDTHHGQPQENKTIISFKNSFWLVVIIVGLFIAALNFVQAESGGEEGHEGHHAEKTEAAEMKHASPQEEGHTQTKPEEHPTPAPAADSSAKHAE